MTKAAIYCRVSTENQEQDGTSLQTQLDACRKYCLGKGYQVIYEYAETYSGLSLERPKLEILREQIRAGYLDTVVIYSLDRWTRDPAHGALLQDELLKFNVILEAVTELIESTDLGKLISYIRGFASKVEAEKIKERTTRGKKAKARAGELLGGGFAKLYGYDYIPRLDSKTPPRRVINEQEAAIVRKIFDLSVNGRCTTWAIADRLREAKAPTKNGGMWRQCSVRKILNNVAYIGKTIAYQDTEKIELPGVTPPIITPELFEGAQARLKANKQNASRNKIFDYLLSGHVKCKQCGLSYVGKGEKRRNKYDTYYICKGKTKEAAKNCKNKGWRTDILEPLVWNFIQDAINHPDMFLSELLKINDNTAIIKGLEAELDKLNKNLKGLDKEQADLLRKSLMGFPDSLVIVENKRINAQREGLSVQKKELESRIEAGKQINEKRPAIEAFIAEMQKTLSNMNFEKKRLALDMLNITVWLDNDKVDIRGFLNSDIVTTLSSQCSHNRNNNIPFEFAIR